MAKRGAAVAVRVCRGRHTRGESLHHVAVTDHVPNDVVPTQLAVHDGKASHLRAEPRVDHIHKLCYLRVRAHCQLRSSLRSNGLAEALMGGKGWAYRLGRVRNDEQLRAAAHFAKHARADALAAHGLRREASAPGQSGMCLTRWPATTRSVPPALRTRNTSLPSTRSLPLPFCASLSLPTSLSLTLARSRARSFWRSARTRAQTLPLARTWLLLRRRRAAPRL